MLNIINVSANIAGSTFRLNVSRKHAHFSLGLMYMWLNVRAHVAQAV
jgi:hypothetical protein